MEAQRGSTIPSREEVQIDLTKLSQEEVHLDIAKGMSIKDSHILICMVLPEIPDSHMMVTKSIQIQACREQLISLLTNIQDHLIKSQFKLLNNIEDLNHKCLNIRRICLK